MEILIKNIEYCRINKGKKIDIINYEFIKGVNIINGPSYTGKTPLMCLISYALCNRNGRKMYLDHRLDDDVNWDDESFKMEYEIIYNNKKISITSIIEFVKTEKQLYLSFLANGQLISKRSKSSTELRNHLLSYLNIPTKVFWGNTITQREFGDFASFYSFFPNSANDSGELFSIADPKKAYFNSFISAMHILQKNEIAIDILRKIDNFEGVENIIKKRITLEKFISILDSSKNHVELNLQTKNTITAYQNLLKKLDEVMEELNIIKIRKTQYINSMKKISKDKRILQLIQKYNNVVSNNEKIDINKFNSILLNKNKFSLVSVAMLSESIENLKKNEKIVNGKIKKIEIALNERSPLANDIFNEFIREKTSKIIETINENYNKEIEKSKAIEFNDLFDKWRTQYEKSKREITDYLKEKKIEFSSSFRVKKSSGGNHFQKRILAFIYLNKFINSKGTLPILIDSVFEINASGSQDGKVKNKATFFEQIIKELPINKQMILTMTNTDLKEIDEKISEKYKIFDSPSVKRKH